MLLRMDPLFTISAHQRPFPRHTHRLKTKRTYDELSDQGFTSLPKPDESECGQIVSEKVYLTFFDAYLSQFM